MNPQLQAKWMEQGWGGGGEVVRKGMVTSALSCQLEKWEEKTTEFSNQEITWISPVPRGRLEGRQMSPGSEAPQVCMALSPPSPTLTHRPPLETLGSRTAHGSWHAMRRP